jgi:DNA-binding GntR family transcriptional regulator
LYTIKNIEIDVFTMKSTLHDKSKSTKAYIAIRAAIISQKLKPGSPIIEQELAKKLNVSRVPIREAVQRLSADGLVDIIPRKGAFIRSFGVEDMFRCYEAAEALEGMAIYLVATLYAQGKIDNKTLEELKNIVNQMEIYLEREDGEKWACSDDKFHNTLYRMCGNKYIIDFLDKMHDQLNCSLWFMSPFVDKKISNMEHRGIIDAIMACDAARARAIMQGQFNRVRNYLQQLRPS